CGAMGRPSQDSEEFGTFPRRLEDFEPRSPHSIEHGTVRRWRSIMGRMEQASEVRGGAPAGDRGLVVKGAGTFRAEQGSDYRPGISADSVGARSLWLGIASIAPGQ